jgi:uncharacterized protein
MNRTTVKISDMHCAACEATLEREFSRMPGVEKVKASSRKGTVELHHRSERLSLKKIEHVISEAGYNLGADKREPLVSHDATDYKQLLGALAALGVVYFAVTRSGIANIGSAVGDPASGLALPLLIGLTAGVSTCMAMVGGLTLGVSASFARKHPDATPLQKFRPHLFFNFGRVAGFVILGGIIGYLGSFLRLSGPSLGFMTLAVALVMLLVGLQLVGIFPRLSGYTLTMPSFVGRIVGSDKRERQEYSVRGSMILGALTFFLPCGFTQAMQVLAVSSGSFATGALTMGLFALGTMPGLLGVGGLTAVVRGGAAKPFYKFVGLAVILMALFNASNGMNLTGLNRAFQFSSPQVVSAGAAPNTADSNVTTENGVQIVKMDQLGAGYEPNTFTIKKGVPVKWIVDSKDQNSCAAYIYSQAFGIDQPLQPGQNVLQFTPKEAGQFQFSCSMGMYGGVFNVVDGGSNAS